MKLQMKTCAVAGIFLSTILALSGCSGGGSNVVTVTVVPTSAAVLVGQVQTFTATVGGSTTTTVTNWPCTYTYTPFPTASQPTPAQVKGNCTSGQTLNGGSIGTWVITTNTGSNVLTYTAPPLSNFPSPSPELTFTATADVNHGKTATAIVDINSGIAVAVTPTSATVPVGLTPAQSVVFSATFVNSPATNQAWLLVQPNSSSSNVNNTTPNPLSTTCSPTCGTIDNNGVYTAPATVPTATTPSGSTTSPNVLYAVVSNAKDPAHFAVVTITLVAATSNAITFSGISPSTIPAGGVEQDIFLDAQNFLNTTNIYFTPPGQTQLGPPIATSNIYTIPISDEYCTPSATGVTPVVTCGASLVTRIRLTAAQLGVAGMGTITVGNIPGTTTAVPPCVVVPNSDGDTSTTSIACPLNLIYAPPALVAAVPDSYPQGQSATLAVDGGYYGGANAPIVKLLLDGALDTVSTFGPRQFVGSPAGSQLSNPGLYEVSIQSNAPLGAQPMFPLVTSNVAVQPNFTSLNNIYNPTSGVPQQVFPPTIPLPAGSLPSSMALDSPKGFVVMTETGTNSMQLIDLTGVTPQLNGAPIPAGIAPTSVALDNGISIPGYAGYDLGVVVSPGDNKLYLFAVSRTNATLLATVPVDLATLLSQPSATGLSTPYAVGVDPGTHLAALAYQNTNIGFIVDVNPNLTGTDIRACFIASQKPPCVIAPVSVNTGATPQVAMQPQAPFAYVTPGGSGSTSLVNLLQQGTSAPIAPYAANGTSGAVRTSGITKIICNTATGINPALGGTVIIAGLLPADLNGTYQIIPGSVIDAYSFSYPQPGLADETETNTTTLGEVQYGSPYYTFNTTSTATGAAINPITRTAAFADFNTSSNQIYFIATLDQTLTSLSLSGNGCNGCLPNPADAPEVGFRFVAFDPYTNLLVAYNPTLDVGTNFITNAISLINPGGPANGSSQAPYRIVQAILTGQVGQGSYTAPGQTTAAPVYGPMTYDPKSRYVLVGNAGANTLSYLNLDPSGQFKKVAVQQLQIASTGVANGQPALGVPLVPPSGSPPGYYPATCDPNNPTTTCMPQAIPLNQPAVVKVFGQGFGSSAGALVRLDANASASCGASPSGFCTTWVSDSEVDVNIPATMLTVAHDYALDVVAAGTVSNSQDLFAVGILDMTPTCLPTTTHPQGPEGIAINSLQEVAYITNYACNSVSAIAVNPAGYVRMDNSVAPYGSILGTVTVGPNPIGIDVIPRLGYAVTANNGDSPTGSASIINIANPEAMTIIPIVTTSGTTTTTAQTVPVGLSPLGVTIDQDHALALIANAGSNTLTSIDLTVLLPGAVTTTSPTPTTVAVSGSPTAIAVDPDRMIAVVTLLQNTGSSVATAGLDVINLASDPPVRSTSASITSLTAAMTGIAYDPAVSPALFYATSTQQNAIYSYNPDTGSAVPIKVGINPYGIGYNFETGAIFTVNSTSDTSSVVDSQTFMTRATLGISSQSQFPVAIDNFNSIAVMVDQNNNRVLFVPVPK